MAFWWRWVVDGARPAGVEGDAVVEEVLVGVLVEVGGRWRAAGGKAAAKPTRRRKSAAVRAMVRVELLRVQGHAPLPAPASTPASCCRSPATIVRSSSAPAPAPLQLRRPRQQTAAPAPRAPPAASAARALSAAPAQLKVEEDGEEGEGRRVWTGPVLPWPSQLTILPHRANAAPSAPPRRRQPWRHRGRVAINHCAIAAAAQPHIHATSTS